MSSLIVILIVIATLKFFVFGGIAWVVFREDIKAWVRKPPPSQREPACMYCGSVYTRPIDEGQTRWENDELVLVSMFQCDHCRLPFWHVQRVPVGTATAPQDRNKI